MHSTWDVLLKLHKYVLATQSSLQGVMLIGANFDSILEIGPKVGGGHSFASLWYIEMYTICRNM